MAQNLGKRSIEVNFLDRPRNLRFDMNAFSVVEEVLGAGLSKIFSEEQVGFRTIRALYFAGLKWEDRTLTLDSAGRILDKALEKGVPFDALMKPIGEAIQASGLFRSPEEDSETTGDNPTVGDATLQ